MTFTYPAVITPHKDDDGFHIVFPDLELCEGDGPDLEDALDDAREAAYNWLMLELEEGGEFPAQDVYKRQGIYCAGQQEGLHLAWKKYHFLPVHSRGKGPFPCLSALYFQPEMEIWPLPCR